MNHTKHNLSNLYISQGNQAYKNKDYIEAIYLLAQAINEQPKLSKTIKFNLRLAITKLKNLSSICEESVADDLLENIEDFYRSHKKEELATIRLDVVDNRFAQGWAMGVNNKDSNIIIKILVDGKPYAITETNFIREDVKKAHGGAGYYGYRAELNQYISFDSDSKVSILPISHTVPQQELNNAQKPYKQIFNGFHFAKVNNLAHENSKKLIHNYSIVDIEAPSTSIIILNLNGEKVLRQCITSILKFNTDSEIIIIDHGSTDGSIRTISKLNNSRIKIINRGKNYSYSDSNNFGARHASGDILIFMNNDIILESDSISVMSKIISQNKFGLLGIKLWDYPTSQDFKLDPKIKVEQHLGVHFNSSSRSETIEAFEVRNCSFADFNNGILETPAVTAAVVAIQKSDFFSIGGFTEKYFYGQEDVDLCLKFYRKINDKKTGVLLNHGAFHIRGLSRKTLSDKNRSYISNNRKIIQEELGQWFRGTFRKELIEKQGFWNLKPLAIAMIVSEIGFETDKADFFTAKELGDIFETDGVAVGYFDSKSSYDINGYDIVIVYIDGFDVRKLKNMAPHCVLVGWARNWFDRWCDRAWIDLYDVIYASSDLACKYMQTRLKRKVSTLRIAASSDCIKEHLPTNNYISDYTFTGSYFNCPREIAELLKPEEIPYKFKLFGHNWDQHKSFGKYSSGSVAYQEIPKVYRSTKLVIDDANIATKKWGAINCRVYDSLAAGVACITNNAVGIKEIFDEDFPVYYANDLNTKIIDLISNEENRKQIVKKYKEQILVNHTYKNRKNQIFNDLINYNNQKKIAIKIAAPDFERGKKWGDYYFAVEIKKELEDLGYNVRIDCLDQWNSSRALNDDINLVIRGLSKFTPRKDQINILWMISHPDLVCEEELRSYDKIYVASDLYSKKLKDFTGLQNIEPLLQASSFSLTQLDEEILLNTPEHEILFIGNSRNEYREIVKWCVEEDLPLSVYGGGWEQFIPQAYIKGDFIDNSLIPYFYNRAKVVLSDHWADMKRSGFISNRIFDVLSVNGTVITDYVEGVDLLDQKNNIFTFKTKNELLIAIEKTSIKKEHTPLNESTKSNLTFKSRVKEISKFIEQQTRDLNN